MRIFVAFALLFGAVACGGDDENGSAGGSGGNGATGNGGTSASANGGTGGTGASGTGGTGATGNGGTGASANGGAGGGTGGSGGSGGSGVGSSLRFYGTGQNDVDRLKIRIDDETNNQPGPPADVGNVDFTIEFFIKASAANNTAGAIACGGYDWINGNIVLDRDRYNQSRAFGISIAGGVVVFGVNTQDGTETICGTTNVLDDAWHHVAVQRRRSDGRLWLWVDGTNEAETDGPDGDLSYPDNGVPGNFCNGPCDFSDPFIVIGAEKHDAGSAYPSYDGYFDELRISNGLRYSAPFAFPTGPFTNDANTAAIYHLDEGSGTDALDTSGAAGGPSNGILSVGGPSNGPTWETDAPF
jgi:hypothetical protein